MNTSHVMQRITDTPRSTVQVVQVSHFFRHEAFINIAKEHVADMPFVLGIGGNFFWQGREDEGRAINVAEVIPVAAWPDLERRFKAMCPFLEDGNFIIVKDRENTDWPTIRLINRQGKMVKEFAEIAWSNNKNNGNNGGNFNKKN